MQNYVKIVKQIYVWKSGTQGQLENCPDFDYTWCCKYFAEEKYMAQNIWEHQYERTYRLKSWF